jgi:hypothetical protein
MNPMLGLEAQSGLVGTVKVLPEPIKIVLLFSFFDKLA